MTNFAIIVEGAHDASFLGQLLKALHFKYVNKLSLVPADWRVLFPKAFPMDGEKLDRVMRFPEIFIRGHLVVGVTTSGSDSSLISALRVVIDALGPGALAGIGIFIDIDRHRPSTRFASVQKKIIAMNEAALVEGQPGYPITVPQSPGVIEHGNPPFGVFLFPDNAQCGALEDILIECAKINHPEITVAAAELVEHLDANSPSTQADLKALRAGMGKSKAIVGTIANLVRPGSSVASSLAQTNWLAKPALQHPFVTGPSAFLKALLNTEPSSV